jgi:enoyl-CoA hydratase
MSLKRFVRLFSSPGKTVPVIFERNGSIAVISINRFERKNAVDRETAEHLASTFREFENDITLKAAILTGLGGTFCSGADLKAISEGSYNRLEDEGNAPMGPSRMQLQKPVIAAISGYAVAGGLELACLCDLRVVEENAILGSVLSSMGSSFD